MIQNYKDKCNEKGVSPVIGVILLVAVTVALVALATVIVFDIGDSVSDTADATVQLDETSDGVEATIIRNENVDTFTFQHEGGESTTLDGVGDSGELSEGAGEYIVIANLDSGEDEVLTSTTISSSSSETLSGTVETNPLIENAEITATFNGETVSDTTDENGEFEIDRLDNSEVELSINLDSAIADGLEIDAEEDVVVNVESDVNEKNIQIDTFEDNGILVVGEEIEISDPDEIDVDADTSGDSLVLNADAYNIVDDYVVIDPNGLSEEFGKTMDDEEFTDSGSYQVIAILDDGTEENIKTVEL